jgi:ABC-type Fe2+-enterobactin transport system substrate-binding protein
MNFEFSTEGIDTSDRYALIPKGDYTAVASSAEVKSTKSGEGQFLEVKFTIVDGPCEKRVIYDRFNFKNASKEAETIGKQQLARFLAAIGKTHIKDTHEVLDILLTISIGVQTRKDNGEDTNRIVKYSKRDVVASVTQGSSTKPW